MSVLDAKAAVLATRADCGRLRADLNHSLECLRTAGINFLDLKMVVSLCGLVPAL
jgi:hypothetical protein